MIFIFTILLIQAYIQINYYHDKNHANSTVITQYVEIALNNRSTVLERPHQNGRKMTSFQGATAKLGACVDNELGGLAPH